MKSILLLGFLIAGLFTSCYSHRHKVYKVNDDMGFKREFHRVDKMKMENVDGLRSTTKYYMLCSALCNDTLQVKNVATKIFMKHYDKDLYQEFDRSKLVMTNDSIGYFDYSFRIIHGRSEMLFDKKRCMIIFQRALVRF